MSFGVRTLCQAFHRLIHRLLNRVQLFWGYRRPIGVPPEAKKFRKVLAHGYAPPFEFFFRGAVHLRGGFDRRTALTLQSFNVSHGDIAGHTCAGGELGPRIRRSSDVEALVGDHVGGEIW